MKGTQRSLILCGLLSACFGVLQATKPVTIEENNWTETLEGEWMVEFMAPWCPACRSFTETWEKFAEWSNDLDFKVGVVDVTENPGLSGRFLVSALPTIYHVKDGLFRQYKGGRKESELISFIDDEKWMDIDPVVWYFSPNTLQMGGVGFFFKAAMQIRALYNLMTAQYGIPEWACYVIFAVLTISVGLLLGLMIVCCCDMVFPTKYLPPPPQQDLLLGEERPSQIDDEDDGSDEVDTETSDILDDTQVSEEEGEKEAGTKEKDGAEEAGEEKAEVSEKVVEKEAGEDGGEEEEENTDETNPEASGDASLRRRRPKKAD